MIFTKTLLFHHLGKFLIFVIFISACGKGNNSENFSRKFIDKDPSVTPLSPEESIRKFQLPPGYHVELVAAEPMVQEPVALCWDGNGRMYVAE
jgi:hypothetical protein